MGREVGRVCGPDLLPLLVDRGREVGARHFFYGGAPGVAEQLAERLAGRYPGMVVAGMHSPPFRPLTPEEDKAEVELINAASPDFVWVGLGSPKQDLWIDGHRNRLDAAVLFAVGAAFDFHAGTLRRAPVWMQRTGTEWFYRLISEPRRLLRRYTVVNTRFVLLLGRQILSRRPNRA
jgi:N-acetylglucosaminyldiphosphoundecaprenol N-acetyl-beta-D-mannosaminyltransferase